MSRYAWRFVAITTLIVATALLRKTCVSGDVVSAGMLVGGVLCFFIAAFAAYGMRGFISRSRVATGKVVRSYSVIDGTSNTMYASVVEFTATGGKLVEFTKPVKTAWEPIIGDAVRLLYDPDNPTDVKMGTKLRLYADACLIFIAGAALATGGYLACGFSLGAP